jgi:hypothetical protein
VVIHDLIHGGLLLTTCEELVTLLWIVSDISHSTAECLGIILHMQEQEWEYIGTTQ